MQRMRIGALLSLAAALAGCGGGSSGSSGGTTAVASSPTPTPTPTVASGCTLRARQDFAFAQLQEWYLFPETLPASLDPTPYGDVQSYVDALTATARAQGKDRYFTYVTSIAAENAYYSSGSSAGFGFRLGSDSTNTRVIVAESFEGTAALAAGIDRGTEILAIGDTPGSLRTISQIVASGDNTLSTALGPSTAGTTRSFQIKDSAGTRTVTIAKTDYSLDPVSTRYGAKIITDAGRKIGYVNLRTFITTADPELRAAFLNFKNNGVTDVIVDLRYNGGGLISIAQLFGNLLGANRSTSDVFDYVTFRPEKAANNSTDTFAPQPQSIAPTRIAFIGTGGTASASELVVNGMLPYLGANEALIGTNTYGKPVGQIAEDNTACDDRFRIIALALQNANHQGSYYSGLASVVQASCAAADDLAHPLGDPGETSTRAALDYIEGKSCTKITAGLSTQALDSGKVRLLTPDRPDTAQREVPGLY